MHEQPREFGKRRSADSRGTEAVPEARDFTRDRPMYERLRKNDPQMEALFQLYDGIGAAQDARFGVRDDSRERENIEKQIRERYEALS